MNTHTSHSRQWHGPFTVLALMAGLTLTFIAHPFSSRLRADTETVCVSVSVVGYDNGDPGTGCAEGTSSVASSSSASSEVSSASSESSSSSDSSVSSSESSSSSASSDASSDIVAIGGGGGGGPTVPIGSLGDRIDEKIAEWARLHRAHTAAPPDCGSFYEDVPSSTWFTAPVRAFRGAGYIDADCLFHPADTANRAEFAKILVNMSGGILGSLPGESSFNDVSTHIWYFPFLEEAARQGWMLGDKNCYGSRPCFDMPAKNVTRAEAAQMIVRFFHFTRNGYAPTFSDNPSGPWYTRSVQIAADHCVLLGDDATGLVRPNESMNRAEMVTMLARALLNLTYGVDCIQGDTSRIEQHAPAFSILPDSPLFSWSKVLLKPVNAIQSIVWSFWDMGL